MVGVKHDPSGSHSWYFKAGFFSGVVFSTLLYLIFYAAQDDQARIFLPVEKQRTVRIPNTPAVPVIPPQHKPTPSENTQVPPPSTSGAEDSNTVEEGGGEVDSGSMDTVRSEGNYMRGTTRGRFGNCLFNYAAVVGISRRTGHIPITSNSDLARVFEIEKSTLRKMKHAERMGDCHYKVGVYCSNTETLSPAHNYTIAGYRQSFKYFDFMRDELLQKQLRFREELRRRVKEVLQPYRNQGRPLVGVHVRHNEGKWREDRSHCEEVKWLRLQDMLDLRNYKPAPADYFVNAFDFYRRLLSNPIFVVVSDDKRWCRKALKAEDVVVIGGKDKYLDFATAASCDHSVVSIGTFSWWTGYLTGGLVVYYKEFPFNGHNRNKYVREDYYPPRWIGMNASSLFGQSSYQEATICSKNVPAGLQPASCGKSASEATKVEPITPAPSLKPPSVSERQTPKPTTSIVETTEKPTSAVPAATLSPTQPLPTPSPTEVSVTASPTTSSSPAAVEERKGNVSDAELVKRETAKPTSEFAVDNGETKPSWSVRVTKTPVANSYVFAKPKGRFGNKIFNVAATLGIGLRNGHQPVATTSEMVNVFKIPGPKLERPGNTISLIDCDHKVGIYCPAVESLNANQNYTIKGYRQSFKYFDAYREEVRNYFQFQDVYKQQADEILEKNKDGGRPFVGVHVRHNSNNLDPTRYKAAPKEYFQHAFDFFQKKLSNPIFLVISDDLDWCKKELRFERIDVRFVRAKHYHGDFALASGCNHSVISIGTFSWWTGYLAGGTVVYYKKFPFNGRSKNLYVREDYYPPDWIGMDESGI